MRLALFVRLTVCCFGASFLAQVTTAPAAAPREADRVANFSLLDYRGKHYELRRVEGPVVVLFFTGADCPIARQTAPKIKAVEEEFRDKGVTVWMVNATPQNDPGERRLD